jgi:predicted permease
MSGAEANARLALAVSTIGFGYFLKRIGLVNVDVGKALLKILFNATLPAMLLLTFASLTFDATSVAISLCAMAQAAVLFVAHLAFRGTARGPKDTALLAGSCIGVNLGTFAYPLVEAVWGSAGVTRLVLFDAVNQWSLLIIAPLIYASTIAGAAFSSLQAFNNVKKQLLSPCLLAMFAAVVLRAIGLGLPAPVVAFTSSLAVANKPLALLALGVLFEPALRSEQIRDVASLLALRYGVCLLLGAALLGAFSAVGPAVLGVVLTALISPVPLLTVTYAVEYGCDVGLGAAAVNAANLCSFALLLAVANADLTSPVTARALAAAGAVLAAIGAAGARNGRVTDANEIDGSSGSSVLHGGGDARDGTVVRGIARSPPVERTPFGEVGFSAAGRKSFGVACARPRSSAWMFRRRESRAVRDGSVHGSVRRPSRAEGSIVGSRARCVAVVRFG